MSPLLWRRREVWLPTLWGWLLLLALLGSAAAVCALHVDDWLAPTAPARGADGAGARTLVVEGWIDEPALGQAAGLVRAGRYERVLTTGGPIEASIDVGGWGNFALRGAALLRRLGVAGVPLLALPAPASAQERTYLSAVMVRDWAQRTGTALGAVDVYTASVHGRRTRMVFRMALGDAVEVGVIAARPGDFDTHRWWSGSEAAKTTLGELISLAWTACCFWPGPPGTHEERWAVPRPPMP